MAGGCNITRHVRREPEKCRGTCCTKHSKEASHKRSKAITLQHGQCYMTCWKTETMRCWGENVARLPDRFHVTLLLSPSHKNKEATWTGRNTDISMHRHTHTKSGLLLRPMEPINKIRSQQPHLLVQSLCWCARLVNMIQALPCSWAQGWIAHQSPPPCTQELSAPKGTSWLGCPKGQKPPTEYFNWFYWVTLLQLQSKSVRPSLIWKTIPDSLIWQLQ